MEDIIWGKRVPFHLVERCSLEVIAVMECVALLSSLGTYEMETWGLWLSRWRQSNIDILDPPWNVCIFVIDQLHNHTTVTFNEDGSIMKIIL